MYCKIKTETRKDGQCIFARIGRITRQAIAAETYQHFTDTISINTASSMYIYYHYKIIMIRSRITMNE